MKIASDIYYIGVNDDRIDLFEGMYRVPKGIAYNSYVIMDEKIAILDTVDKAYSDAWLENLRTVIGERKPNYLIVQHMEPDHSANVMRILEHYPEIVVVASAKAFGMMNNYFECDFAEKRIVVSAGDTLDLGKHTLQFISAMMVHWPEVIMTYDCTERVLFTADAFGKFGTIKESENTNKSECYGDWISEARRYYFGIVGKYGISVQKVLAEIADLEVQILCPLHGPILKENIERYVKIYDTWSRYQPEEEGILIAYTSMYGNTKKAVQILADRLNEMGYPNVMIMDLARCDMSDAVAQAFRYSKVVLASSTYNVGIFPAMREFIEWLVERNFCNRTVALMENGSWMPVAGKLMREKLEKCKGITFAKNTVKMLSVLHEDSQIQLELLANELCGGSKMHREYYEIRLESIGGLGANLCGKMLGELGLKYLNFNSTNFSSYGSEKTGTPVKGYIRYCDKDKEIRVHSPVTNPDLLVVFHQALLKDSSVWSGCGKNTDVILALDEGQKPKEVRASCAVKKVYGIGAQRIALETRSRINVVMLGAILKVMGLDSLATGEQIMKDTLGKKYPDVLASNIEGMKRGYAEVFVLDVPVTVDDCLKKNIDSRIPDDMIGGINPCYGNSVLTDLSPSRQGYIPIFIKDKCINCGLCFSTCPDMVFCFQKGVYQGKEMMVNQGLDYKHCKGCMRCVDVCPVHALVRGEESELQSILKEKSMEGGRD